MKKLFICLVAATIVFGITGCEKVASYKEGVYEASVIDNYNNENNTATAKITIDKDGKIKEVYLDTTYVKDGEKTTKKTLKDNYNMKKYTPNAAGEWYEQVEKLEKAIVENQGLDFLNLNADGKTDAVSGCTIKIDALYNAAKEALEKASK